MKNILIIVAILSLFVGCEDSKKRTTEIKETILKKELIPNSNTQKKELKPKIKLTNENAVSFLTEFGVENPENNIRECYFLGFPPQIQLKTKPHFHL